MRQKVHLPIHGCCCMVYVSKYAIPGSSKSSNWEYYTNQNSNECPLKRGHFKGTGSVSHRILQSISLAIEIPRVSFPSPTCGRFAGTKQRQYANQQGIKKQWQQGVSVGKYLQELERYNYQEMVLLTIQQCSNHDGANVRCLKLPAF